MYDYYPERVSGTWSRYQSPSQPMLYPYYDGYEGRAHAIHRELSTPYHPRPYEVEEDSEDENELEKATREHVEATSEYNKAKATSEDAKKQLEESEAKLQAATKRLEKAKRDSRRSRWAY